MKVAIRLSDYLPEPPTPRMSAFPLGYRIIRAILAMCSQASKNITNFIGFFYPPKTKEPSLLYSS